MNKLSDFLAGIKVIEELDSPINGRLTVVKSVAFGTYIQAGGLTQSGGIIKNIWNKTLRKVSKLQKVSKLSKVLILGLGGGSLVEIVRKFCPEAKITAIDVDPLMVELGKTHLGLDKHAINIKITDAMSFVKKTKVKYDLICIDLYNGDQYPEKFEKVEFVKQINFNLSTNGVAVFNRLYYGDKRPKAVKFLAKLEKEFGEVEVIYPEANVMFVCFK